MTKTSDVSPSPKQRYTVRLFAGGQHDTPLSTKEAYVLPVELANVVSKWRVPANVCCWDALDKDGFVIAEQLCKEGE